MITVTFNTEINRETVPQFIEHIDKLAKETEKLRIYFCSNGGEFQSMQILLDYVNTARTKIELVGYGQLTSAAFIFFFKATCDKILLEDTYSIIHVGSMRMEHRELLNKNSIDTYLKKDLNRLNDEMLEFMGDVGISGGDIKKMKNGHDVYLNYNQLKDLL